MLKCHIVSGQRSEAFPQLLFEASENMVVYEMHGCHQHRHDVSTYKLLRESSKRVCLDV